MITPPPLPRLPWQNEPARKFVPEDELVQKIVEDGIPVGIARKAVIWARGVWDACREGVADVGVYEKEE